MKFTLIIVQIVAVLLLILNYFDILTNKYIPVICYAVLLIALIITLITHKKNKVS